MSLTPDQLRDDIAELKRRLIVQSAELVAAKNGLLVSTLEVEKLKAQIGRLKRQTSAPHRSVSPARSSSWSCDWKRRRATQAEAAAAMPGSRRHAAAIA